MIRVISFARQTDEGARQLSDFAGTFAKAAKRSLGNGGGIEHIWQTAGEHDFIAVVTFPDMEAEFKSRNEVNSLGIVRVDHVPAIPMEQALKLFGA